MISRQTLIQAPLRQRRPSHPENPQKSCKSSFRQSAQISRKLSSSLVKRSCERTCANVAPPIPKIPRNPANPAPDNPPNLSQTLVITRQTRIPAPLRQRRPSHPENPQKSCKSSSRQSPHRKSQPIPKIPVPCTNGVTKNQKLKTKNFPRVSYQKPKNQKLKTYPPQDRELLCYSLSDV